MTSELNFPLITGQISIDLVNTELIRHGIRHDLLRSPENVIEWFQTLKKQNILCNNQFNTPIDQWAERALPLLREVRLFLRENYERMADGENVLPDWVSRLELLVRQSPFAYELQGNKLLPIPTGKPENALVALIALNALKLLSSDKLSNIHRCANPECVLLFIDTRGRRKWCSMKICGNRKKVTRHQKRTKKEK
ncbi:CGNR zinc finger domain-containing protein [Alteribacillus bidgolensis]|uniref:Conserved protein containing a Zn-ribbon-like motif, possibly RNA-binding n=1 Tax=Alteribacillus bidgolensis TaxID=930129 RepID=A0A1G8FWF6_9BACI|nr:CGNR zinc finger domain-containing protein [Alteribacillus bidgolensis]SDH86451.1 Conserved protein containing a Zn-ribbon-like motif, possibly RNA-binding [Alteribacillus bidgolensis]